MALDVISFVIRWSAFGNAQIAKSQDRICALNELGYGRARDVVPRRPPVTTGQLLSVAV